MEAQRSYTGRVLAQATSYARYPITSRNKIITALPDSTFARLAPRLELVSYKTGNEILKSGQLIEYVHFPETLVVSQLCYLADGSSAGTAIIGHDGVFGLSALANSSSARYWAVASIGGTARRIRVEYLRAEYGTDSSLQRLLFKYLGDLVQQLAQRSVCSTRHRLEERLSTWLLMILDRTDSSTLPLTHEAISEHLGVRRAGVTNFCNLLRDRGVVTARRGRLTILDRNALEDLACECYRAVGLQSISRVEVNTADDKVDNRFGTWVRR